MKTPTGTGTLIRLALRRDRIKLPLWILAVAGLLTGALPALKTTYATAADLTLYAQTTASSIASRLLAGPVDGPNIGSVLMMEMFLFLAILAAFMSTLLVVRHTRQNEELGRSELIGSLVVGRHAALTAALAVAVGANLVVSALLILIAIAGGLDSTGAVAMGLAVGGIGITFAGIAGVAVQFTESARTANSMAAIAIGVAFLVRGMGDALGQTAADGLSASSMWLSWLSPMGWGQQMHPFTETQLWPLGLYAVGFALLVAVGFRLSIRRDVGAGLRPARKGPARAAAQLLSPLGLAWRLQRGVLVGWAAGIAVLGVITGLTSIEFRNLLLENEQFTEFIGGTITPDTVTDSYFAALLGMAAIVMAGYVIQGLQRLRSEEASGRAEPLLATSVSRPRWMASHSICVIGGAGVLLVVMGVSTAVAYILAEPSAGWSELARLTGAAFAHAPAILALAGIAIAVFGLLPRAVIAVSWTVFAFCLLVSWLGTALNFPQWVMNLSPFAHIPAAPGGAITAASLVALAVAAVVLAAFGFVAFRRRDIAVS